MAGNLYAAGSGQPAGPNNPFPIAIYGSQYQDLGIVIDTTNMAAGAVVSSNWIDNVNWVRNAVLFVSSDQQYDVGFTRRDQVGNFDQGTTVGSAYSALTTGNWRVTSCTGSNGLFGYSVRFYIKNSSASANTFGKLRAQLLGL